METSLGEGCSDVSEDSNHTESTILNMTVDDEPSNNKLVQVTNTTQLEEDDAELFLDVQTLPDHSGVREEEIPAVGLRFDSLHQAHEFYATYAKKVGFVTKIRTTTFDRTINELKRPINQSIHCNREGFRGSRVRAATRTNKIAGIGCRARIYVKFDREKENWVLLKVELKHSHPYSAKKAVHYHEYRDLTMHAKCVIEDNDEAGIRPNKTFLALANEVGGSSNLGFSEKDVRNYITSKLRFSDDNADVKEMLNYFMRMKEINPNFFYAIDVDSDYKFKSAIWVDARCRASYEYFGDVVSFDTTYRRNRHGLPFASFVGVNHHGKSTLLRCALLGNEEIPSFEWVFTQWLKCMGTAPQRIITDQCKSMFGAIRNVFPQTRYRWCIWHILKKIPHKLGGYRRFKELNFKLGDIIWNSRSVGSFEDDWAAFIKEFNIEQNRWLSDLYDERHMWVPIFFKGEFWAGMRSTQRSESMHAFYGGFLHCKSSLVQFVHEYDNVIGNKEQKELEDDAADSKGLIPCASSSKIELQFQQEYTSDMFREVQVEFVKKGDCTIRAHERNGDSVIMKVDEEKLTIEKTVYRTYDVHFNSSTQEVWCECNMFESSGILCCHCLAMLSFYRVNRVPALYVLPRWSKNVKRKHTYIKSSHDVSRSAEGHNLFRGLCAHFFNVAQDFVTCPEIAAMLHSALDDTRSRLTNYLTKMQSKDVVDSHNSTGTQSECVVGVDDIQGPAAVTTKGRPKNKRLGADMDRLIKQSVRRRKRNPPPYNDVGANVKERFGAPGSQSGAHSYGGFMSLLNSFGHS